MTFDKRGFLSSDIEGMRSSLLVNQRRWFSLAYRVSESAQSFAFRLSDAEVEWSAGQRKLATQLFVRVMSNNQGAILLAERGMIVEARILVRSCLETTFFLGALSNREFELVDRMLSADSASKRAMANGLMGVSQFWEVTDTTVQEAVKAVARQEGMKLPFEEVAKKANLLGSYHTYYRQLSSDAAHPTVESLARYIDGDKSAGEGVVFGPDTDNERITETMFIIVNTMLGAGICFNQIVKDLTVNSALINFQAEVYELKRTSSI